MQFNPSNILYEDNHIIAINKPPGILTQGDITGDKSLIDFIKLFLKKKYKKPGNVFVGLTHRIDRPVSGIVLFSKTSKCLSRLNNLFKEKKIKKTYWCITENCPPKNKGKLIDFLIKNRKKNKSFIAKETSSSKLAELEYNVLLNLNNYYFLKIKPLTGKHHQIRCQLSNAGAVIKGDVKYGAKRTNTDKSIHLHARSLEFVHPVKKEIIQIIAPPPKNILWDIIIKNIKLDPHLK